MLEQESHHVLRVLRPPVPEMTAGNFRLLRFAEDSKLAVIENSRELEEQAGYLLYVDQKDSILKLERMEKKGPKGRGAEKFLPFYIDIDPVRMMGQGPRHGQLGRALGIKGEYRPQVVDGTCGLAKDSMIMASLGCKVVALERSPLVLLLLQDALERAGARTDGKMSCLENFSLMPGDSRTFLSQLADDERPDVVYLDPMFEDSSESWKRKGAPRKEIRIFQDLLQRDEDSGGGEEELLQAALRAARRRVVVKRPLKGPYLGGRIPEHSYVGQSVRYDLYICHLPFANCPVKV